MFVFDFNEKDCELLLRFFDDIFHSIYHSEFFNSIEFGSCSVDSTDFEYDRIKYLLLLFINSFEDFLEECNENKKNNKIVCREL